MALDWIVSRQDKVQVAHDVLCNWQAYKICFIS